MRFYFIFFQILCFAFLCADEPFYPLPEPKTQEEALFLRRISEFWNEGNFDIVKIQMLDFLKKFPSSNYTDMLQAILGDLSLKEKEYEKAAEYYKNIKTHQVSKQFLFNKLQCYRSLGWYQAVLEESEPYLEEFSSDLSKKQKLTFILADALYNLAMKSPQNSDSRKSYANLAKIQYESLQNSPFQEEMLPHLAYTYHLLGESEKASNLYITLAQKHPSLKEEMLFQAATIQIEYDKDLAIQTFGQVCHLGKERATDAAFNRMILMYETKKYPEILLAKEQLFHHIPKEKIPLLHFFIGKSYLAIEDYPRAVRSLQLFLDTPPSKDEECKAALHSLMICAEKLKDMQLFEKALTQFKIQFPEEVLSPILYRKALLNKENCNYSAAKKDFEEILQNKNLGEDREVIFYNFAHLLYLTKSFTTAREKFKEFISTYPGSTLTPLAWRFLINASIESEKEACGSKEQLAADLKEILNNHFLLREDEKDELSFTLAKVEYEMGKYESAIAFLVPFLENDKSSPLASEAHLLLAFCYKSQLCDEDKFCFHAEKALLLNPNVPEAPLAHLALYNIYLKNPAYLDLAAEHLYQAKIMGANIQTVNQDWLASFYYEKISQYFQKHWKQNPAESPEMAHYLDRAIYILESIREDQIGSLRGITLANLYALQGKQDQQIELLKKLQESDDLHRKQICFELAKAYGKKGEKEKALILFEEVRDTYLTNYFSAFSALQSARIRFEKCKTQDDPEILSILALLKDLTIQKTFANEPVYLEAALEYIDIHYFLNKDRNFCKSIIEKTLSDFQDCKDILSKDYQDSREKMPEKEELFQSYLQYMKGELLLCNDEVEDAKKLFTVVLENAPTQYLYTKTKKQLENLPE